MNAESLELEKGSAIFIDPLGHNPAINMFRRSTPDLRTEDEHPLLLEDFRLAGRYAWQGVLIPSESQNDAGQAP